MIHDVFAQNILLLTQTVETNFKVVSASNFLNLHDAVRINIHVVSVHDRLFFNQHADVNKTVAVVAGNVLTLSQQAQPRVFNVSAASYLILTQEARHEDKWPAIHQALALAQVAEAVVAHGAYDTLVLTQEATCTVRRNVSAANTLALRSQARAYKPDKMFINDPTLVVEVP